MKTLAVRRSDMSLIGFVEVTDETVDSGYLRLINDTQYIEIAVHRMFIGSEAQLGLIPDGHQLRCLQQFDGFRDLT